MKKLIFLVLILTCLMGVALLVLRVVPGLQEKVQLSLMQTYYRVRGVPEVLPEAQREYIQAQSWFYQAGSQGYQKAEQRIKRALQISPMFADGLSASLEIDLLQHVTEAAPMDFQAMKKILMQAAALAPKHGKVWRAWGLYYYHLGKALDAERYLKRSEKLNPNDPVLHYYFALLFWRDNSLQSLVRQRLEKAQKLDASFIPARIQMARLELKQENFAAVEQLLQPIQVQLPQHEDVLALTHQLAQAQAAKRAVDAVLDYDELLQKGIDVGSDVTRALNYYRQAQTLRAERPEAYVHEGFVLMQQLEQWLPALRTFQRAQRLDPAYADSYAGLGMAYYQQQQPQDAIQALSKYLELAPQGQYAMRVAELLDTLIQ